MVSCGEYPPQDCIESLSTPEERDRKAAVEGTIFSDITEQELIATINIREPVDLKSSQQSDPLTTGEIRLKKKDKR